MTVDYAALRPGQEISRQTYRLDADTVARYVEAVGDQSRFSTQPLDAAPVPPMAVAALGLRGVLEDLAIPGGAVHAGQELEFSGAVQVGETLQGTATLVQNSVRGEWRFMVVQLAVLDSAGQQVMTGKSTIMVPE